MPRRAVARFVVAAGLTRALYESARPLADRTSGLRRVNHRGRDVDLLGGPALAVAALSVALSDRGLAGRTRAAALVAAGAAAAAGTLDDAVGSGEARGFRGHFAALRRGRLTTGVVKLATVGAGGLAAGLLVGRGPWPRRVAAGGVVALSANLANLLDLRPGRALKAALVVAVPLASSDSIQARRLAVVSLGSAAGLLGPDLRERTMLGDAGANCLGALLGVALVADASMRRVAVALTALTALTAASEVVSFSRVIAENSVLRRIDQLGRRDD